MNPVYFTDKELDYVGQHCAKLQPEARVYNEDNQVDFILLEKHKLCVVKEEDKFVLCSYLGEDDAEVVGQAIFKPMNTIEEIVFIILAIATAKLPSNVPDKLIYENQPITYQ